TEEIRSARMELGKPTRVGQSPAGLVNRADNRHCFEPSRSELSSVTLTVVSLPRKESLGPVNVPLSGRTCFGEPGNGDTNQIAVSHYAIGRIKINPAGARQTRSKVFLDIDSQQIDAHSEIGRNALLEIRRVILILALLLTPAIGGSQTQAPENSGS